MEEMITSAYWRA